MGPHTGPAGHRQAEPLPEVSVTEVFDRAPVAISATYNFQCGDKFATLLVLMSQIQTPSGARVPGIPHATAYLNGHPVGEADRAELEAVIRSVGYQPHIIPNCSSARPLVVFRQGELFGGWFFPEP